MIGIMMGGTFLALIGMSQSGLMLGITMFCFMFPLPFVNASFMSLMQAKIPPDVQGRVFALGDQLSMLLLPLSYLLVGPLADNVFEPAVGKQGWEIVAPLVGNQAGAGMGLILFLAGTLTAIVSLIVYTIPAIRHLEATLPDYVPTTASPTASESAEVSDEAVDMAAI
jgi:hypothetical protein